MKPYIVVLACLFAACGKEYQSSPLLQPNNIKEIVFISRRIDNSADWKMYIMCLVVVPLKFIPSAIRAV